MQEIKDISKQPLIEWGGQTVITSAQLAEAYETSAGNISDNFNRNKDRFEIGKHYILLEGDELKEFKNCSAESGLVAKNARQLYLWTRRGASRHCKILGTDKAWEQFDYLEENYFERETTRQFPQNPMELLELHYEAIKYVDKKVNTLTERVDKMEYELPVLPVEAEAISAKVKRRGVECLGGKKSIAYRNRELRQKLYWDLHVQLRREFRYRHTRQSSAIRWNKRSRSLRVMSRRL